VHSASKRSGHGEDSIYWDESRKRYIGAVDLGLSPAGTRIRKKVSGKTKVEVRDRLRELHKETDAGLRPRRRHTVRDAVEDWLAHGVDGLSEKTVTLYRGTIAKALNEQLSSVRLTDLTATFAAYFEEGGNVTQTARVIHVHVNTLLKRLERVTRLLGAQ
jgi:DNA-binding PucR family transcriptional regulator